MHKGIFDDEIRFENNIIEVKHGGNTFIQEGILLASGAFEFDLAKSVIAGVQERLCHLHFITYLFFGIEA